MFDFDFFKRSTTMLEYLIYLVASAQEESQEQFKEVLCDGQSRLPSEIFDLVVSETKSGGSFSSNQLIDINWKVANLSTVDGQNVNLVLVHLQLGYLNDHTEKRTRNIVLSLEEFSRFYSSFLELSEAI